MIARTPKKLFSFALAAAAIVISSCGQGTDSGLKAQTNTNVTFYAKVVDQDGKPLENARFEYRLEAYPKDWTFDTRGRDNDIATIKAVSDVHGEFHFDAKGCELYRMKAQCKGYQHFFDLDVGDSHAIDNTGYRLIAWGDLWYKSDVNKPAVYVFVKEGAREIHLLPCRGGYNSGGTSRWTENKPGWPKNPSLKDVVFVQPATQP
jgi:hypothetical protein